MKSATVYVIKIECCLEPDWADWFDGMEIEPAPGGETYITGLVRDQAALIGLINRVHDLGLGLVSVVPAIV